MTSYMHLLLLSSLLFLSFSYAQPSFRPRALVLPILKDATTLQYLIKINQRTPLVPVTLVVDLGGQFAWVDCQNNYTSLTYRAPKCHSAQCALARSLSRANDRCGSGCSRPTETGCNSKANTCLSTPENTIITFVTESDIAEDVVSVPSTDGSNPGPISTIPHFLFSCAPNFLLEGLASGAMGMAGFGRSRIAIPSQFSSAFSFPRKFAICISSYSGVIFFGNGPYNLLPDIDTSRLLSYTPLLVNPVSTAIANNLYKASVEYFIGVKSIKIGDKVVPLNTTLLSIDNEGYGGTKISTVNPYTMMESSIYKSFTETFTHEAETRNITRVEPVAPFDFCFSTKNVFSTRVGPSVPYIELIFQNEGVGWTITGSNSMVYVRDDVLCLGFVDGGLNLRTSIVIGGYQFENNLLQFDLAASRLGFSSTLLLHRTTCANFNFTSSA